MPLREEEKEELRRLAGSEEMRRDMERLSARGRRAFLDTWGADTDRALEFLCAFNEFINHARKEFRPIQDHDMRF